MIKSKLFLPFSLWLFFLALTLIVIYSYDPSSGTNTEKTNAMISFTVLLYGPSVFLFGYYLKKKYVLGKIYFFFLIESIWLFVMLLIASVANDSVTIVSIFFGIIPILPFWYKYRKNSYYLINKNNNSNIKIRNTKTRNTKTRNTKTRNTKTRNTKTKIFLSIRFHYITSKKLG